MNSEQIIRHVRHFLPQIKDPKWEEPFPHAGYFKCVLDGRARCVLVDMTPHFYAHVAWDEELVAHCVVAEVTQ